MHYPKRDPKNRRRQKAGRRGFGGVGFCGRLGGPKKPFHEGPRDYEKTRKKEKKGPRLKKNAKGTKVIDTIGPR